MQLYARQCHRWTVTCIQTISEMQSGSHCPVHKWSIVFSNIFSSVTSLTLHHLQNR